MIVDGAAAAVAVVLARYWAFGAGEATLRLGSVGIPYILTALIAVPAWLTALAASHAYDLGPFGSIDRQGRRIVSAGAHFLAVTAVIYYLVSVERVAREFLIAIIPLAVALTLMGRTTAALHLHRARQRGDADRRAVFLGPTHTTRPVAEHLRRLPATGISFVEAPAGDHGDATISALRAETPDRALSLLRHTDADVIVVTSTLDPGELRTLTWALEGSGVTVLVAPPSTPMADHQLNVRPVAGLPLLYVERRGAPVPS